MTERCRVLLVEDDGELRDAIGRALESEGYEVLLGSDGEEAFAHLKAGVRPCVILLDLMMPGMDGWRFMEEVRLHPGFRRLPIVVVSAYGTPDGGRSLGAAGYLKKPFGLDPLLDVVSHHCPAPAAP